jgi:hypothetical protein
VMYLAWNYLVSKVPNDPSTGKPAYYSRSYINPATQAMVDWPHNPAGLYGMMAESALKYYQYSGDIRVMAIAESVALWHLDHGMTLPTDKWASVPYASGNPGATTYGGSYWGDTNGIGDGTGYLQPDKIGELGYAWLRLYQYDGNTRFRDAAIQCANALSSNIRTGSASQSPWPFRANAATGAVKEDYCANVIGPISLFDGLITLGLGNTSAYQAARATAWTWLMSYPMQNNVWTQYFEDVPTQAAYNTNINQYDAMMTARYLLEHPEYDATWESHVRGLISWVETSFGTAEFGATTINEQSQFFYPMGSHTSRYASVNALLFEKTGDLVAKEKSYRAFSWATYMAGTNGVVIDGPLVNNEWFTDGYADYIRHFATGMGAVPEWSPFDQSHLLRSGSVVKTVTYGSGNIGYTTFDGNGIDVVHLNFTPVSITADGAALQQRTDLSQAGWVLDGATKTVRISHPGTTNIVISATAAAPLVQITGIANNGRYTFASDSIIALSAKVTDLKHPDAALRYKWEKTLVSNGRTLAIHADTAHHATALLSHAIGGGADVHWTIRLTVIDPEGLSSSDSVTVYLDRPGLSAQATNFPAFGKKELKIVPNPFRGAALLQYDTDADGPVSLRMMDMAGREVSVLAETVHRGRNTIMLRDQSGLKPGVYVIRLRQGNSILHAKAVVL